MRSLTRRLLAGGAVAVVATGVTAGTALADDGHRDAHHARALLRVELVGSLTTDPVIAGVKPGAADWAKSRSSVRVQGDGDVRIKVRGLVFTSSGVNTVPMLSASLVCNGAVVDQVGPVAFSTAGDARIDDTFTVPERCLAPAVLLNPGARTDLYIAASAL